MKALKKAFTKAFMQKLSALLAAVILLPACPACPAEGESAPAGGEAAAPRTVTSGKWTLEVREDGTGKITGYSGTSVTALEIPEELDGIPVTAIGDQAFDNSRKLETVRIPASVTEIGVNPFVLCVKLQEITVAENHPCFESRDGVLYDTRDLRLIACPPALPAPAFAVPADVKAIGSLAFCRCAAVANVSIPASVTEIGANPFALCTALAEFRVAEDSPSFEVKENALCEKQSGRLISYPCGRTETAYAVPEGIRTIGEMAFCRCVSLQEITLPASVSALEPGAFFECTGLTAAVIPEGVTEIPDRAFSACEVLSSVTLPGGVSRIGNWAFFGCMSLPEIVLPQSLAEIGYYAFSHCSSLTAVEIPEGTRTLGPWAFSDCENLQEAALPASVGSIGYHAFDACAEGFLLTGPEGSYARQYARDSQLPFEAR